MKILYVTTVGMTSRFFENYISVLLKNGHTVEFACNSKDSPVTAFYTERGITVHDIDCSRSPFSSGNIKAVGQIRALAEKNNYDIIHCHTPIAAACTRLACRSARKKGTKVFYTAHGFHFYKGAPAKNWAIFYPVERICARFTDVLFTITKEDYALAQKKLRAARVEYVPGVGVDIERFASEPMSKREKREELKIPNDALLLLSVGELNTNKNHQVVLRALSKIEKNIHYVIAGVGDRAEALKSLAAELGMAERFHLLGFRRDIPELCRAADAYILPSVREGLNVSTIEAMASGLPCIVGRIRGNVDLIDEKGGALFEPQSAEECRTAIESVLMGDLGAMGKHNAQKAFEFNIEAVNDMMLRIYESASSGK